MAKVDFLGIGFKWPISLENDHIAMFDDEALVRQSILNILHTAKGERVMRPDYGSDLQQLVFAENTINTKTLITYYITDALEKWEPRIDVLNVDVEPVIDSLALMIRIEYRIKTRNQNQNLVFPFYLKSHHEEKVM